MKPYTGSKSLDPNHDFNGQAPNAFNLGFLDSCHDNALPIYGDDFFSYRMVGQFHTNRHMRTSLTAPRLRRTVYCM